MGLPERFGAGDKIRHGLQLATYITISVEGVPNISEAGTKLEVAHKLVDWLHHPCRMGGLKQDQPWRTSVHSGFATPPSGGSPTLQSTGQKQEQQ